MDDKPIFHVEKRTILLSKGEICNYVFKVTSGCLKSYVIDESGKEHILEFAPEGWLISDIESFLKDKASSIFIEAIEDSKVVKFPKAAIKGYEMNESKSLTELNDRLFRNIMAKNRRLIGLLSSSAEERYLEFVETYPMLIKKLPLKLIASYIGVTPEYLSEIRRKLIKK